MTARFPPFALVELVSPCNKKNITRWLEDMNFMFSWQEQYLTNERSSLVRYCSPFTLMEMTTFPPLTAGLFYVFFSNPNEAVTDAVEVKNPKVETGKATVDALLASGFTKLPQKHKDYLYLIPCPMGTFSNSSSQEAEGCIPCPPGICIKFRFIFTK